MAYNVISCKKIQRNTRKKQNHRFYYVNSAPELRNDQKSPKNESLNCDLLNFFIGMVYFGCLQVNPHIQAVQNMCGKGG